MQDNIIKNQNIIFHTPLGSGAILYRENPFVIIKVLLPRKNKKELIKDIAAETGSSSSDNPANSHPRAAAVADTISDYFKGILKCNIRIPWEWMDMGDFRELEKAVLIATSDIPYGELRFYKEIAEAVGHPGAARFVGNTVAKNPFPIIIPCHRVVRSDGTVGKFGGGSDMKAWLIALEESLKKLQ